MSRADGEPVQGAVARAADDPRAGRSEALLMWVFASAGALLTLASALLT